MDCRPGCAACCIAPSISSPLPGLPKGKPAGLRCPHLLPDLACDIWGRADYPEVCRRFRPGHEVCGSSQAQALALLEAWEEATRPGK
ncbi:MAG: YkgJ family cysteine cluster protein [Elusimicrobia bacterium]|nr:YkgJ family cysteine cluster protein [Elusimicrobiota bacterium]